MSEKKRGRLRRCQMCLQRAVIVAHAKCENCRVNLQLQRYADAGKLTKFVSKKRRAGVATNANGGPNGG